MSQVITAVYEHGALHPVAPLNLPEHQRVQIQIVREESQKTIEQTLEWLTSIGRISPPQRNNDKPPCSDEERAELAHELGKAVSTPLSQTILDDRGEL